MASNDRPVDTFEDVHICILAGGSGTRLWPRSRTAHPKQLLNLAGESSLLQQTIERVTPLVPEERIYILTGPEHAELIAAHLPDLPRENILVEPTPRGTAPALGMAAVRLRQAHPGDSIMISLHADHVIGYPDRFRAALCTAVATARTGHLVTIGIVPAYPETGFGYIERGELLGNYHDQAAFRVARFREKPPLELAEQFVESGRFYWNTGYFCWTLDAILSEFNHLHPHMYTQLCELGSALGSPAESESLERIWPQIERVTIDVGIMEQAANAAVVPCDLGWSDIGSWASLHALLPRDDQGNVVLGQGSHIGLDTHDSLVFSEGRLIATIGLANVAIVDTGDAVLVLPLDRAQDVSRLVKELRARGLDRYL